jgi:hypothetical protein
MTVKNWLVYFTMFHSSVAELSEQVTLALGWNWSGFSISSDFGVGKSAHIEEAAFDLPT